MLAFAAKDIKFQRCETDLQVKAEWHKNFNGGFIPVLESPDGTMINESAVIANFACDFARGQGLPLWPHEAAPEGDVAAHMETGQHRLAMQKFDSLLMGSFWRPYMNRFTDETHIAELKAQFPAIEEFFKKHMNGNNFLSGRDEPMMIDVHCFPMAERLILLEGTEWNYAFEALDIKNAVPTMYDYVHRMQAHPKFANYIARRGIYDAQLKRQSAKPLGEKAQLAVEYLGEAR